MTIDIHREKEKVCLHLQGSLDGVTAAALHRTVQELLGTYPHIYLDLRQVASISDVGVQTLSDIQQKAAGAGGCVHLLVSVPALQNAKQVQRLTNLTIA